VTNSRFATRLFPHANFENETLFDMTMTAIRSLVEANYTFHGLYMAPSEAVAGYPGRDSGVNPAWRTAMMHADIFDFASMDAPAADVARTHDRLVSYTAPIRAATAGSGAYVNEADVQEPDWQRSFIGANYQRLREIKIRRDPWGLFWAPSTVGSEGWAVKTADGLPTQNGMLCRVE
jgi:Berberine and berberine like